MRFLNILPAAVVLLLPCAFAQNTPAHDASSQATASAPAATAQANATTQAIPSTDAAKAEMADRVRAEALHAWNGYKQYAWGHDALKPLSRQPFDWYGQGHTLLMTPVDALDTLTLMGLTAQADEARKLIVEAIEREKRYNATP